MSAHDDTSVYYWSGSLAMAIARAISDLRAGYTSGAKRVLETTLDEFIASPALLSDDVRKQLREEAKR